MSTEYEAEVFAWGNGKPWGKGNLNHQTSFGPDDVQTDGLGNITLMPLLHRKPCFGRPEVYLRQHGRKKTIKVYGRDREVAASRCGSCLIAAACKKVVFERIKSDTNIRAAVRA